MFRGIRSFNRRDICQWESPVSLIDGLFALSPFNGQVAAVVSSSTLVLHAAPQISVRRRVNLGDIPT